MTPIETITTTKHGFWCPGCGTHWFGIDHLLDRTPCTAGPWQCGNPECRTDVMFKIVNDHEVEVTTRERKSWPCYVLLKLDPDDMQPGHELFIVTEYDGLAQDDRGTICDNWDFFFHEHQCPENFLRGVVAVISRTKKEIPLDQQYRVHRELRDETWSDPHGLFKFVASIPRNASTTEAIEHAMDTAILELFNTDGNARSPDDDLERK
ncbi:MAG: hypothetical protein WC505_05870 [Patescibacteria group bacterium]